MNRREFVLATGAAVLAARADAAPDAGAASSTSSGQKLIETASACIQTGELCEAHCFRQLAAGDTSLAQCAASVNLMLPMCRALVTAAAQSSPRLKDIAKSCGLVCRDCEAACKPHAGHHEICRQCMEACRACATACERAAA